MTSKDEKKHSGIFITIEGADGSGKSTIGSMLYEHYIQRGLKVMLTREPGGIEIAEKIRDVILNPAHTKMDVKTEALLYAAARSQHLSEKVIPALCQGYLVLCDRFVDSSLAYQGFGREIGLDEIWKINEFAISGYLPDLTLLFELDPTEGLLRINKDKRREINRLDLEEHTFHYRVTEGYQEIKKRFSNRIEPIDANKEINQVFHQCIEKIDCKIKNLQLF